MVYYYGVFCIFSGARGIVKSLYVANIHLLIFYKLKNACI